MSQYIVKNVLNQLRLNVQVYLAVLHPGDGKQIFHQMVQPVGVLINCGRKLPALFLGQQGIFLGQNQRVAGNACQRGAQVMADAAQQVGAQLFLAGGFLNFAPGAVGGFFFQRQGTHIQDG